MDKQLKTKVFGSQQIVSESQVPDTELFVCLWQGLTGQHLGCSWTHFEDQAGSNSDIQLFYTLEQEKSFRKKLRGIWINSDFN